MADVNTMVSAFLLFYAGLFPIVNPIGAAPIFLGLTRHCTDDERNALALRVTINCFFLLLGSMLIGSYVLDFFGITPTDCPHRRWTRGDCYWLEPSSGRRRRRPAERESCPADRSVLSLDDADNRWSRIDRGRDYSWQPAASGS